MPATHPSPAGPRMPAGRFLSRTIDALGTPEFGGALLGHIKARYGADHFAVFQVDAPAPCELVTGSFDGSPTAHQRVRLYLQLRLWHKDPAMQRARAGLPAGVPMLIRVDPSAIDDEEVRETIWPRIRDKMVVAGRIAGSAMSINLLREGNQRYSAAEIAHLRDDAELLMSLIAKHVRLSGPATRRPPGRALGSLLFIEQMVQGSEALTRREAQVCARILHGLSTAGIALDLGIGEETVRTFRKLAYRKLGIGSQRELLDWYLGRWS
ncbi:MAG TPA: helix-turn-helix transcriptional regulator [Burkholderiaceae bacterium]|mgnify:CR=1 FL=1|nr:helix-turn-helix transcriptional regulator [Burkholderiaceae bacterium]